MPNDEQVAKALGWFSIGLGLTALLAPKALARLIGARNPKVLQGIGAREIVSGIGILARPREAGWVWSRVAGDAMDLSLLGEELASDNPEKGRIAAATAAVVGVTVADVLCARGLSRENHEGENGKNGKKGHRKGKGMESRTAVTIDRPAQELYDFWHRYENLPRFMTHLESVQDLGGGRTHWRMKGPAGKVIEWDAETVEDRPGELISWRSVEGSDVKTSGSVRFRPATGGRGTVVTVDMMYDPPGGVLGTVMASLFGENPDRLVYDSLRAFKQVMELGEVVLSDGTVREAGIHQRPGQPVEEGRPLAA